ncbi:MAG: TetR/AcrR family transcriptional regulator [Solirubrobacterales bacterium]
MEAASQRTLTGDKAQRIVGAMRASVAERGATGSTFDRVAREAGVSRGLLHYYFGTKEKLLAEVVRQDAELRLELLDEPLMAATHVDDIVQILVAGLRDVIDNDPGFFVLLYELFSAGRRNPEIHHELGELFDRTREHVAEILRQKAAEGVISARHDAEALVSYLFALADGYALQVLSSPGGAPPIAERTLAIGTEAARALLDPARG